MAIMKGLREGRSFTIRSSEGCIAGVSLDNNALA